MKAVVVAIAGAILLAAFTGCETPTQGAITGGLLGAGTGAVIGDNNHHQAAEGALIGGAIGALGGALYGSDKQRQNEQRQYAPASPPPPPPPPPQRIERVETGHYETRIIRRPTYETYEERVWVPDR